MLYKKKFSDFDFFSMNDFTNKPFFKSEGNLFADGKKSSVLIFSRDDDTRFLYRTLLEMWNYRVADAATLEEAISSAAAQNCDLIMLDCVMPFGVNLKTLGKLRENTRLTNTPIVLISGFAQPSYQNLALLSGANDYLIKPVDFDLLENSLQKNICKDDSRIMEEVKSV